MFITIPTKWIMYLNGRTCESINISIFRIVTWFVDDYVHIFWKNGEERIQQETIRPEFTEAAIRELNKFNSMFEIFKV